MKKIISLSLLLFSLFACTSDSQSYYNPYLPNVAVQLDINLDWPEYSELRHVGGIHMTTLQGIRGIIIINTGSGFRAYDAACPNHELRDCSTLEIKKGDIFAKCRCPEDGARFNLHLGTSMESDYQLHTYLVRATGNRLFITN